jgi:hypothetical protein
LSRRGGFCADTRKYNADLLRHLEAGCRSARTRPRPPAQIEYRSRTTTVRHGLCDFEPRVLCLPAPRRHLVTSCKPRDAVVNASASFTQSKRSRSAGNTSSRSRALLDFSVVRGRQGERQDRDIGQHEREAALAAVAAHTMMTHQPGWRDSRPQELGVFEPVSSIEYCMPTGIHSAERDARFLMQIENWRGEQLEVARAPAASSPSSIRGRT